MLQLNLTTTPDFEINLYQLMNRRGISNHVEAIAIAVKESLERTTDSPQTFDFSQWIGCALKKPENPHPQFKTEDAIWE